MNSLAPIVLLVSLFCFASLLVESRYQPVVGDSFFIDLASGDSISRTTPGPAANIYDVNLTSTSNTTIAALQALGIKVVCYVRIGVASSTDSDYASFPSSALGNHVSNASNLRYLDVNNVAIYPVIQARIDLAAAKGCDGVDLAYSDTYGNATSGTNTGFDLTLDDSVLYFQNIANYARIKDLAAGLRNGAEMVPFVEQRFADFAVVENCFYENSLTGSGLCGQYSDFIQDYQPVFPIEYYLAPSSWCRRSNKLRFFGGFYPVSLNGSYTWCSTVATIASTPSPSLKLSTGASVGPSPSLNASPSLGSSVAASNPASPSVAASNPASSSVAPSASSSVAPSASSSIAPTASSSNPASVAASVVASVASSVDPSVGTTAAASPSLLASLTSTCITCTGSCGPTSSPLYRKCSNQLQGTPSSPTTSSFCCAADLSQGFSYSWRVSAANCSVPLNGRKLGQLCSALSGTVTCATTAKAGKVKLTCA